MADTLTPQQMQSLHSEAMRALGARDFATARAVLGRMTEAEPSNMSHWLGLATACRHAGAPTEAIAALDRGLQTAPRHFMGLLMKASILEAIGDPGAPEAYGIAIAQSPDDSFLDPPTLKALNHAREVHRNHTKDIRSHLFSRLEAVEAGCSASEKRKLAQFCDDALRLRKRYQQEPVQFYYPGLPALEVYDRELFPWIEDFEAQTDTILNELLGVVDADFTGFVPYIDYPEHMPLDQWRQLNHNPDWGAFHLINGGQVVAENANRCPKTMQALKPLPQPDLPGRGPSAMFSALKPHTHIPPHTGISNTRLVVHLPLIVPENCGFRVGNEVWPWTMGQAFVFDDTLEHEAWNRSDKVRIVLIVDIWSPFLSPSERTAIAAAMAALDSFGGG